MSNISENTEILRIKRKNDDKEVYVTKIANNKDVVLQDQRTFTSDITFYSNMYECFEICAEVDEKYEYAEISFSDRFTMNSYKAKIQLTQNNTQSYTFLHENEHYTVISNCLKDNIHHVTIYVPITDVMCGNVYALFYDDESKRDEYTNPIIFDVNNAPSVYVSDLYKWHPNDTSESLDSDNVFNDTFGEFWNKTLDERDVPDSGRVNVLTADDKTSESYNDFLNKNRLITNGVRYNEVTDSSNNELESLSGHPIYTVVYETFVPETITKMYGNTATHEIVGFAPVALHKDLLGQNCCAYLTNSANYSTNVVDKNDAFNIKIEQVSDSTNESNSAKVLSAVSYDDKYVTIVGHYQQFNAYLGCISGKNEILDGNGTMFNNRPSDEWFKAHSMLHVDFELSGLDPYWID